MVHHVVKYLPGRPGCQPRTRTSTRDKRLPEVARACLAALGVPLRMLKPQVPAFDRRIMAWHRSNEYEQTAR